MGATNSHSCSELEADVEELHRRKLIEQKKLFLVCKSAPLPPVTLPGAQTMEAAEEPKKISKYPANCLELKNKQAVGHEGKNTEFSKDNPLFTKSEESSSITEADIRKIEADGTTSHVEKAVKFAKEAVTEDNKANYEIASQLYTYAVKSFVRGLIGSILKDKPNVKWTDVAGLEDAKELLNETLILPIKFPQLFTSNRRPWRGILLYGLRGTGKTLLAKAAAAEAKTHTVFSMKPSNLMAKWLGESEKLPKHLFDMARKLKPSIIFIDEVDSLCTNDPHGTATLDAVRRMVKEFALNLKGMEANNDGILVLGATCCPWKLDDNLLSLFEKKIYIPLPDENVRLSILKGSFLNFPHTLKEDDFKCLAKKTDGYSGEDITVLIKDASLIPFRKIQKATHFVKISGPSRSDPSVTVDDLYMPCTESHPGAKEINLMDIPEDKLLEPKVTLDDVLLCLENSKPADKQEEIKEMSKFMESIGQKSSDIKWRILL